MKKTLIEMVVDKFEFTKEEAIRFIKAGDVTIKGQTFLSPHEKYTDDNYEFIKIKQKKEFVSRGAYKLKKGLEEFEINIDGKVCLDIGSSTGGFTEIMLKNGAKKVYSLDSGTNQLDFKLRRDEKVISLEKTNLKTINKEMFNEEIDFVAADVSFISLKHAFRVLKDTIKSNTYFIALIKPQFEANSDQVQEGGFVPMELHQEIINKVYVYAFDNNFDNIKIIESPIKGFKSKNIEYISLFRKK